MERQMSVEEVLRAAGLPDGDFKPRHGWSNQAWVGPRHVVRISSGRLLGSFIHEARMVELVARHGLPVAPIVALGLVERLPGRHEEAGEWLVSQRLPGDTLAALWPTLDRSQRARVGANLGELLRILHSIEVADVAPLWWIDAHDTPNLRNAYRPHVELGPRLVEAARELPHADDGLLTSVEAMLRERLQLFADDHFVLVHGDIHGHNVLVHPTDAAVSGILDWEGAHTAPADVELDMLLRWATTAHDFPESPTSRNVIEPCDYMLLVESVATSYRELFDTPHLKQRLEVYDVHWHLVQLLFDRYWRTHQLETDTEPAGAWGQLRQLVEGRSHLNTLGL